MLEFNFMPSFPIVEFVTSEFSLALTVKFESKPCSVGFLNIIFLITSFATIVYMKPLSRLMAAVFETYRCIARCLHIKVFTFGVPNVINNRNNNCVNEASSSCKGFSYCGFYYYLPDQKR